MMKQTLKAVLAYGALLYLTVVIAATFSTPSAILVIGTVLVTSFLIIKREHPAA